MYRPSTFYVLHYHGIILTVAVGSDEGFEGYIFVYTTFRLHVFQYVRRYHGCTRVERRVDHAIDWYGYLAGLLF